MTLFPGMSGAQIEQIAVRILRQKQPEVLEGVGAFDVERMVDLDLETDTGIDPDYTYELPEGVYGLTNTYEDKMYINAALSDNPYNERFLRSTLAHEVGHCVIHVPTVRRQRAVRIFRQTKDDMKINLYRKDNIPIYMNPEWQAWHFAGALLMPRSAVEVFFREGASVHDMGDHFRVNGAFVRYRLRALKLKI